MATSQRVKIGVGDFFLPRPLLEQTRATSNPLLAETAERARRLPRRLALFMFEALLVLGGGYALLHQAADFVRPELYRLFLLVLAFLLVRYQLLRGDCAGHLGDLTQERLRDRLPRLTREDVFLHHFLRYARQYQALGGLVAIFAAVSVYSLKAGGGDWRQAGHYPPVILCLNLVLLTWMAAAAQHVFEWRMRAGALPSWFWAVATWVVSLVLAALTLVIALVPLALMMQQHWAAALVGTVLFFGAAVWIAFQTGRNVYNGALEIVRRRLRESDAEAPAEQRTRVGAGDLMLPWRWRFGLTPEERAAEGEMPLVGGQGVVCLALTVCFGALFFLGSESLRYFELHGEYFARLRQTGLAFFDASVMFRVPVAMFAFYVAFRLALAARRGKVGSLNQFFAVHGRAIGLLALALALAELTYILQSDIRNHLAREEALLAPIFARAGIVFSNKVIGYLDDLALWCILVGGVIGLMSWAFRRAPLAGAFVALVLFGALMGAIRAWGAEYYQEVAFDYQLASSAVMGDMLVVPIYLASSLAFSWIMLVAACELLRVVILRLGRSDAAPQVGAEAPDAQVVPEG